MGFGVAIEFARIDTVRFLPFDSPETFARKAFPLVLDGGTATIQRVSDFRIAPAFVGVDSANHVNSSMTPSAYQNSKSVKQRSVNESLPWSGVP